MSTIFYFISMTIFRSSTADTHVGTKKNKENVGYK